MPRRRDPENHDGAARDQAFDVACSRARGRYAAAVLLVFAAACHDRERWPEPERERPQQPRFTHSADLDCPHGDFCAEASRSPKQSAPAPFADCEAAAEIPGDVAAKTDPERRALLRVRFDEGRTKRARVDGQAASCCYFWFEHCHGRPILVRGRPRLARCVRTDAGRKPDHALAARIAKIDRARRERIGRAFRRDAVFEHASIFSFERFAADLARLGAPSALVAGAQRAATDEARHARAMFELASAFTGRTIEAGALSVPRRRPPSLAALAASTFTEGCVAETIAASLVREAATRAADPVVRRVLARIARDEARHAELAWRTVAWASTEGEGAVDAALVREARRIERAWDAAPRPRAGERGGDEVFGVLGAATRRIAARRAFDRIVQPCTELLLG